MRLVLAVMMLLGLAGAAWLIVPGAREEDRLEVAEATLDEMPEREVERVGFTEAERTSEAPPEAEWAAIEAAETASLAPAAPVDAAAPKSAGRPHVRLRALDENGRPIVSRSLFVELVPPVAPERRTAFPIRTESDGTLCFLAPTLERFDALELRLTLMYRSREIVARRDAHRGAMSADRVIDLGDVMLREPPQLASGHVLDELRRPVAGARVEARVAGEVEPSEPPLAWTESEEDGSFRIAIEEQPAAVSLVANEFEIGFFSLGPTRAAPGTSGLVLNVARGGRIVGSVLLDPDVDPTEVRVSSGSAGFRPPGFAIGADRELFSPWLLPPGRYDLTFTLGGATLAVIEEVVVPEAGKSTSDPRLEPVDLSGKTKPILLAIVGPDGKPWGRPSSIRSWSGQSGAMKFRERIRLTGLDQLFTLHAEVDGDGSVSARIPASASLVSVEVDDFAAATVHWRPTRQTVRLRTPISVRLEVEDYDPADGLPHLMLSLQPIGRDGPRVGASLGRGTAKLEVAAAGVYEVRAEWTDWRGRPRTSDASATVHRVTVEDGRENRFVLVLDQAELERTRWEWQAVHAR